MIVVGSINADLVVRAERLPTPGETVTGGRFARHGGGKGANQAVAAARLGARVAMVGAVGGDDLGAEARAALEREGIDVSALARLEGVATGVALICVDAAGENQIAVASGANAELAGDAVERAVRVAASAAGGGPGHSPPAAASAAGGGPGHSPPAAAAARAAGRPGPSPPVVLLGHEVPEAAVLAGARAAPGAIVLNPAPARALPDELVARRPILTPNAGEACELTGERDPEAAARALAARTGAAVLVTLGAEGVLVLDGDGAAVLPAPRVEAVDTTGAGDAFNGALAAELAAGRDLRAAAAFAIAAAAHSTRVAGARDGMPRRDEIARA